MNTIATTPELNKFIKKTLANEYGWDKLSLTRAETFGFLQQKQEEAAALGVRLHVIEDTSANMFYIAKLFAWDQAPVMKRIEISTDAAFKSVVGFAPSPADIASVMIEVTEKPRPQRPTAAK